MTSSAPDEPIDILLVEDNPGDVRLIQEAFNAVEIAMDFRTVTNGKEALDLLDTCQDSSSTPYPDLILLDLNLPRVDGFAVLEALRDDPAYPPLPVLVLTSSEAEEDVVKSYEEAANAYLTKPTNPDEFVALAEAVAEFWADKAQLSPE